MIHSFRRLRIAGALLFFFLLVMLEAAGCKTSPTDPTAPQSSGLQGTYLGYGAFDGTSGNVLMQFEGPDSAGGYTGAVRYHSVITSFDDIYQAAEGDSMFCRFRRNGTTYRFWGIPESTGLPLHIIEPSGVTDFRVNRESPGYNMSGLWNGQMSSALTPDAAAASMMMDQRGQIFSGTLDVSLPDNPDFEFTSGAAADASFQLSGHCWVFTQQIPAEFAGTYWAQDTINGV
ncbi:MAG: hypothetical protein PHI18_08770, partial [bacterium]|nr:hypothetical protein [bacterium]